MSSKPRDYREPFIVEPQQQPLKQTFILLHGRGSSGPEFGPALLAHPITPNLNDPSIITLASKFPHARFVFPSAPLSRAHVYNRSLTHQWFNNWKLDPPAQEREQLQVPGLQETTNYLHMLIEKEIKLVPGGARNIVFGGLSQGCAAALVAALLWEGDKLGAVVGMCGWLPFAGRMEDAALNISSKEMGDEDDDFFERENTEEDSNEDAFDAALGWLREELEIPAHQGSSSIQTLKQTPIFLGHGVDDDRVDVWLGRKATSCLKAMGVDVYWKEYEELAHWYSGDMLRDLVDFIESRSLSKFEE